ncbi:MAG TPA: ABC transporter ATP-binding protein [Pseudoclavibacter sp.]|nr:ABC transporter ATP-binding protein [Pseudoclavibacter sp.]
MYKLNDVSRVYQQKKRIVRALDHVTLTIPDGDFVAVQGPTGGGKSTFLQMLGALDRPTQGTITLDEVELSSASDAQLSKVRAETIGFIFQGFNLIPTLTARENVETALVPTGYSKDSATELAQSALESVGLAERGDHLPNELSGGQQQRVAIARAIIKHPKVLLADEPTGNLDEETRDDIMRVLEDLREQLGLTMVIVTHDSSVAARAKRRLYIKGGHLSEQAKTRGR